MNSDQVRMLVWSGILVLIALLVALIGAGRLKPDTSFSVRAITSVMSVDVPCSSRLVWDLPPGDLLLDDGGEPLSVLGTIGATMRGGTLVRVAVQPDGALFVEWHPSEVYACPANAQDLVTLDAAGEHHTLSGRSWYYRSAQPIGAGPPSLFLLEGRIRIGEELVQGAGLAEAGPAPMLESGVIEARTPDRWTQQKRLIHLEELDSGSEVDSHACLGTPPARIADCVAAAQRVTSGFIHPQGRSGDGATLAVQVAVQGPELGIRQFGGVERRIVVTRWSATLTSTFAQILVATLAALAALANIVAVIPAFVARRQEPSSKEHSS